MKNHSNDIICPKIAYYDYDYNYGYDYDYDRENKIQRLSFRVHLSNMKLHNWSDSIDRRMPARIGWRDSSFGTWTAGYLLPFSGVKSQKTSDWDEWCY